MNEKRKPHYSLVEALNCIANEKVRATKTAYDGASLMGIYSLGDMCAVIRSLKSKDFYKSMTTHHDHAIWQDVYRPTLPSGIQAYVKITIIDDLLIVSFKEL